MCLKGVYKNTELNPAPLCKEPEPTGMDSESVSLHIQTKPPVPVQVLVAELCVLGSEEMYCSD